MAVIPCPACGTPVNDQATACPACGADPRLLPDVARARVAEQDTAARARDSVKASFADPVGVAKRAAQTSLRWLQIELPYDAMTAALVTTLGVELPYDAMSGPIIARLGLDANRPPSRDEATVVESIEAEGWQLHQVEHVFRPTVVQTSVVKGVTFWGTDPVEGEMRYFYLFRRV